MSAGNVTSISEAAARRGRRGVSFHEKLEDARERRAAVLGRTGASVQAPAPATVRRSVPPPPARKPLETARPAQSDPVPADAAAAAIDADAPAEIAPDRSRAGAGPLTWFVRGLSALLVILVGVAWFGIAGQTAISAPDFAPPQVRLAAQGYGPPLLASVRYGSDRPLRTAEHAPLINPAPAAAPTLRTAAPAPRGPVVMPVIEVPAAPSAGPTALIVMPNDARPAQRPEGFAADVN